MRRLLPVLALLTLLTLVLGATACSSDGDDAGDGGDGESTSEGADGGTASSGADDYVDALVAYLTGDPTTPLTEDEGRCMAEGIVDIIGADALTSSGVPPEQFAEEGPDAIGTSATPEQAEAVAAAYVGCMDSPGAFLAAGMGATSDEAVACIEDNLDEADLEAFIAAGILAGDDSDPPAEVLAMFQALAVACPEAMSNSTG